MFVYPRIAIACLLALGVLVAGSTPAVAMPPSPEVYEQLRVTGNLDEFTNLEASARRRGVDGGNRNSLAASGQAAVTGNLNVLAILVEFSDELASGGGSFSDSTYFNNLLFSTNNPGYSMNDHYYEMSYGDVTISGRSVGWFMMPETYAYYVDGQRGFGNYPRNAQRMAEHAVDLAEAAGVDFSLYDNDGDGFIDGVFIVHAGPGYEATGDVNQIHSHQWYLGSSRTYDGVTIDAYTAEPEERGSGQPINVGVYSHEFGHFLGLPDLYDTDYTSAGIGRWCLMASGSWANGGTTPTHFSAWCKSILGWVTPINVTSNLTAAELPQVLSEPVVYRLWAGGSSGNEYFLVENRQKVGWDAYLHGPGLCIWHIDESKGGNSQEWYPGLPTSQHALVALEQADGDWDMEHDSNSGDAADPYPGSEVHREFSEFTTPGSQAYSGISTQTALWNISDSDSLMTANLDIFFSIPFFALQSTDFADDGNADGRPDPGENVSMSITHTNLGAAITDASFSVSADDTSLIFTDSTALIGAVNTGQTVDNTADPFLFTVPADFGAKATDFYLTVTADGGAYVKTDTVRINVGPDQILVVDDDAGLQSGASYDSTYLLPILDSLQIPYARWDVEFQGTPGSMNNYPMVIWMTGDRRLDPVSGPDTTLTPSERAVIASYLDAGGHLWLTGQQIANMLNQVDSAFMHDYLHAAYGGGFNDFRATGVDGDVVGDQSMYALAGAGGAANQLSKDLLIPVNGGIGCFTENGNPAKMAGVRYDGAHRVLFLSWGMEAISDIQGPSIGADVKSLLINRAIDWLLFNAVSTSVSLQPLVTNPGQDPTHLMDTNITLHWNFQSPASDPQDSIQLEVGSDQDWGAAEYWSHGPVASADSTVAYGGPTSIAGNTYYWRLRVYSGSAWSNWSTASWHMNAPPNPPIPSAPIADQIVLESTPQLRAINASDPEGDACTYDFEVYTDSALTALVTSVAGIPQGGSSTTWSADSTLAEHARHWWRVRAHDGYLPGAWSDGASFYVDGINEAPSAPALVAPADQATQFSASVDLSWTAASDPDLVDTLRYRVQIDTQSDFSTATVYDSLTTESWSILGTLESARTYWWNVTTFDKGGLEAISPTWQFSNLLAGDVNKDGAVSTSDLIELVNFVFKGGPAPDPVALGDVDASCAVTSGDLIYLVVYIFKGGPDPLAGCATP